MCHEVTEAVVAAIEADPPELLVTYHPLLFRAVTRLVAGRSPAGRAWRLVRAGVALAVAHTNFDVAPGGTADALGAALDLQATEGIGPAWGADAVRVVTFVAEEAAGAVADAMRGAGAGQVAPHSACSFRSAGLATFGANGDRVPELRVEMVAPTGRVDAVVAALVAAHPSAQPAYDVYERRGAAGFVGRVGTAPPGATVESLAAAVRAACGGVLRVAGDGDAAVRRVAVVPGAGSDYAAAAHAAGADALVTGDVSHHRARAALDRGLAVLDPGHVPTERPGLRKLYAAVRQVAEDTIDLGGLDASPWQEPWEG